MGNGNNGSAFGLMQKAAFAAIPLLLAGFVYMLDAHNDQSKQISNLNSRITAEEVHVVALEKSEAIIRDELRDEITRLRNDIDKLEDLVDRMIYKEYERPMDGGR